MMEHQGPCTGVLLSLANCELTSVIGVKIYKFLNRNAPPVFISSLENPSSGQTIPAPLDTKGYFL